ncbi:Transketolase, chloroplastic [Prototheca wickerhamii]|uniref:transketolase n=1 Tax=Prototheca wickerhamii TaxID=3111 RepID=A0AAD9MIP8_PROWI|nr:Transketolase, chloroplastic [Prototheca wickerhamii]
MTHDSVGLGEDGPTHQPIEHLASFRAMPNILMLRPGDGNETAGAYKVRPSVFALSRQGMPNMDTTTFEGVAKGAYVVAGPPLGETPDVILVGTGSELVFAVQAGAALEAEGIKARVVSMPCWELYDEQPQEYKDALFPPSVKARVSIEAGSTFGWVKYLGPDGYAIGVDHFGNSAPGPVLYEKYGLTADNMASKAKEILAKLK